MIFYGYNLKECPRAVVIREKLVKQYKQNHIFECSEAHAQQSLKHRSTRAKGEYNHYSHCFPRDNKHMNPVTYLLKCRYFTSGGSVN